MNIFKTSGNESVVARSSLWVNTSRLYFSCSKLNFHVPGRLNICEVCGTLISTSPVSNYLDFRQVFFQLATSVSFTAAQRVCTLVFSYFIQNRFALTPHQ